MRWFRSLALFALGIIMIAVYAACSGDGPTGTTVIDRVEITVQRDTLVAFDETLQLQARAFDANNNQVTTAQFEWSCGATCDIVDVVSSTGLVTARGNGEGVITATVVNGSVSANASLVVSQATASVELSHASVTLNSVGATHTFTATALDHNDNPIAGAQLLWLSSNHAVAVIDGGGVATATGSGAATITAAAQGVPGTAQLVVDQEGASLAFVIQPSDATAGASLSPAVQVEIRDGEDNRVVGSRAAVTLSIGVNAGGDGTLSGTRTVNAVDGIASFSGLWIDRVGSGYTLSAAGTGLTSASSAGFAITPGAPAQLAFSVQPSPAEGNEPFSPAVAVVVQDAFGNLIPTATNAISVDFDRNPSGARLLGTTTVNAVAGVATFADIRLDRAGEGYTLAAFADGIAQVTRSTSFGVNLTFAQLAGGNYHTCGVTVAGHAFCWGANWDGQLGSGVSDEQVALPILVAGDHSFAQISAGSNHTCALTTDDDIYCWGWNGSGQLGTGSTTRSPTPVKVAGTTKFKKVSAGSSHSCAISANDAGFCWGSNGNGRLGDNSSTQRLEPAAVFGGLLFMDISAGASHSCGVTTAKAGYCWGFNGNGRLGDGTINQSLVPVAVSGSHSFVSISASPGSHSCGIADESGDTEAWCWGYNGFVSGTDEYGGQLGDGTITQRTSPVLVSGSTFFVGVGTGSNHSCALRTTDERAYCWGRNYSGQIGDGTDAISRLTRVLVSGDQLFSSLAVGRDHNCAITTDGVAYCWGDGSYGQLGVGQFVSANVPARVVQ